MDNYTENSITRKIMDRMKNRGGTSNEDDFSRKSEKTDKSDKSKTNKTGKTENSKNSKMSRMSEKINMDDEESVKSVKSVNSVDSVNSSGSMESPKTISKSRKSSKTVAINQPTNQLTNQPTNQQINQGTVAKKAIFLTNQGSVATTKNLIGETTSVSGVYTQTPVTIKIKRDEEAARKETVNRYLGQKKTFFDLVCRNSIVETYKIMSDNNQFYFVEAVTTNGTTYFVEIPACDEQCQISTIPNFMQVDEPVSNLVSEFGYSILETQVLGFGVILEDQGSFTKLVKSLNQDGMECMPIAKYVSEKKITHKKRSNHKQFVLIQGNEIPDNITMEEAKEIEQIIEMRAEIVYDLMTYAKIKSSQIELGQILEFYQNVKLDRSKIAQFADDIYNMALNFNKYLQVEKEIEEKNQQRNERNERNDEQSLDPFMKNSAYYDF